jgi:hypothetical protein
VPCSAGELRVHDEVQNRGVGLSHSGHANLLYDKTVNLEIVGLNSIARRLARQMFFLVNILQPCNKVSSKDLCLFGTVSQPLKNIFGLQEVEQVAEWGTLDL